MPSRYRGRRRLYNVQAARARPHPRVKPELVGYVVWVLVERPSDVLVVLPWGVHNEKRKLRVILDVNGEFCEMPRLVDPEALELLPDFKTIEVCASAGPRVVPVTVKELPAENAA